MQEFGLFKIEKYVVVVELFNVQDLKIVEVMNIVEVIGPSLARAIC